jgi:hypothetical protein
MSKFANSTCEELETVKEQISAKWGNVEPLKGRFTQQIGYEKDTSQAIIENAKQLRHFQLLRSESKIIYDGALLCSQKKFGYCFEHNETLMKYPVIYDFGTNYLDETGCPKCTPFKPLIETLRSQLSLDICFDLTLKKNGKHPLSSSPTTSLHILQSNKITPRTSNLFEAFPPDTVVIHADPGLLPDKKLRSCAYVFKPDKATGKLFARSYDNCVCDLKNVKIIGYVFGEDSK